MDAVMELFADNESVPERLVTSAVVIVLGVVVASVAGRLLARRATDAYGRYYLRKAARYVVAVLVVIALAIVWQAFAGRVGVVLGLITAGLAFAMQEVIGALAGWFNVLAGRIFRVGDRIQMGGVRGDVIDITPLRTKVLEIGSTSDDDAWVRGRQPTGRVVAISNKATFTEPVFNYSTAFEFIWEELTVPVAFDADWHRAERILTEEVRAASSSAEARQGMEHLARSYPVPSTDLEPRVFSRATDDYLELSARFIVPVRTARAAKDELTRRVLTRFDEAGLEVASSTQHITVRHEHDSASRHGDGGTRSEVGSRTANGAESTDG